MKKPSAGIMLWRRRGGGVELLLVHPGGPFWKHKDEGAWSIPKGEADHGEAGEELLAVARREFEEETSFTPPPGAYAYAGHAVRERDGKRVDAWAVEGDFDPSQIRSNTIEIDWPKGSGKKLTIPEVDRGAFFTFAEARKKISPFMAPLIDRLEELVGS